MRDITRFLAVKKRNHEAASTRAFFFPVTRRAFSFSDGLNGWRPAKFFRGAAAFAGSKLLRLPKQEAFRYAIRIKSNAVRERDRPPAPAPRGAAVA
jgi:hypothetical protein